MSMEHFSFYHSAISNCYKIKSSSIQEYVFKLSLKMQGSYTRNLLYSIADKIGRSRSDMEGFIKILESNWYDTKESLRALRTNDYQKLQIPARVSSMIMEAVGSAPKVQQMDIEVPLRDTLISLKSKIGEVSFNEILNVLIKLFGNIRQNITEEKFRTLRKTNAKIASVLQHRQAAKVLQHGGFEDQGQALVMIRLNLGQIDEVLDILRPLSPSAKFNPYESHIASIGDTTTHSYEGESSVIFNEKLSELEKERQRMMSKPIKDRQIRIFQIQSDNRRMDQQFNEQKEYNNEDERIYIQNMKQILKKQGEQPKFMNRRKAEYFELVKKPCFTQTLVRVKLPDNWIFECKFSPLETLQTLADIFEEYVEDKKISYYLYMTPPVQKLSGLTLRKTFYDLGCVPRAVFYFKTDDQVKGSILRTKKKTFGFF